MAVYCASMRWMTASAVNDMKFFNKILTNTSSIKMLAITRFSLGEGEGAVEIRPAFLPGANRNPGGPISIDDLARAIYAEDDEAARYHEFMLRGGVEEP